MSLATVWADITLFRGSSCIQRSGYPGPKGKHRHNVSIQHFVRHAYSSATLLVLAATLLVMAGCVTLPSSDEQSTRSRLTPSQYAQLRRNDPISNLYDEGFHPVPGLPNTYYLPNSNVVVRCDNRFTLNASMKRTFQCVHLDANSRAIPGSNFVVQINPWKGGEGFSPYRPPVSE